MSLLLTTNLLKSFLRQIFESAELYSRQSWNSQHHEPVSMVEKHRMILQLAKDQRGHVCLLVSSLRVVNESIQKKKYQRLMFVPLEASILAFFRLSTLCRNKYCPYDELLYQHTRAQTSSTFVFMYSSYVIFISYI